MITRKKVWSLLGLGCLLAIAWLPVWGQPPEPAPRLLKSGTAERLRGGSVMLNYEQVDIKLLARLMAELTGKNIVVDPSVNGQITVISSRKVSSAEAWRIFEVALNRAGFELFDRGGFVQVLPIKDASRLGPVLVNPSNRKKGTIIGVIVLKEADVNQMQNALRPLLSPGGSLFPYPPSKAIVVADQARIVSRIAAAAKELDIAHPSALVSVVFPKYAEAKMLAPMIESLVNRPGLQPLQRVQVKFFEPSNAVVIYGDKNQIAQVKGLPKATRCARIGSRGCGRTEVFRLISLQNATAEDIASILAEMLSEKAALQQQRQQTSAVLRQANAGGAQPAGAANNRGTPQPTANGQPVADNGGGKALPFVSAKVASDPETNSLIFYLSPSEYEEVKQLVAILDAPRKQVLVTAVVAEVSLERVLQTSSAFQVLTDGGLISTFNGGLTEEGLLSFLAGGNFVVGGVGSGNRTINVNGRDVNVPEVFGFAGAQKNNNDFNLISAPRILTEDHKEAEMNVGNVVPFATGARFDNFGQPTITYDYRDVGIKMKVTPHVSQSDSIKLEIEQEVQEVTDFLEQNLGGFGYVVPLISNRNVNTTITVKDGQTLVIGGLISKRTIESMRKIPILGDVPLLKHLFREKRKEEAKTTLFISLTPHIVTQPEMIERIDKPYQDFLQGDRNPRDHQPERRPNEEPFQSPYEGTPKSPTPVKLVPNNNTESGVRIDSLRFLGPLARGRTGQAVVTLINQGKEPMEVVAIGNVREPNGDRKELKAKPVQLSAGQKREVPLPGYAVPQKKGTYEFDVAVWNKDQLVGRLGLPTRVQVK